MMPYVAAGGRSIMLLRYLATKPGLFRKCYGERCSNETLRKTGWSCTSNAARHAPPVDRTSALDGLSGRRCESVTLGSERRRQSGRTEWVTLLLQGDKGTAYLLQQFWGIGIVSSVSPYLNP